MKKFRDPVYGYIEIEENIVHKIIDTAAFQRLRNIRQTSYGPLYPSSLHNRFVHSLGVYHLGCLAFKAIENSLESNGKSQTKVLGELRKLLGSKLPAYKQLFKLACLLHDVGHSPFSHTGEEFYANSVSNITLPTESRSEEAERYNIYRHLAFLTKDPAFSSPAVHDAAEHEVMSCIVALEAFGQNEEYFQNDEQRSFFARCITGLQYNGAVGLTETAYLQMNDDERNAVWIDMFQNCLIQLLHSSVIDVDRLDYIIRDASTMGYQSVSIDYQRLLSGLEIIMTDKHNFSVGFHKNAISVIENAVYAHDNEKKWVQSHPAILYESYILQQAIIHIETEIKDNYPDAPATLFSFDSLTGKGSTFAANGEHPTMHIRYLGDADLIYLMKNCFPCEYAEEYFSRDTRRLPVWKSEAEFKNLFNDSERKRIVEALTVILNDGTGVKDSVEISEETLGKIKEDIDRAQSAKQSTLVEFNQKRQELITKLLEICQTHGIKKSLVLLSKSYFKSNFSKDTMNQLPMLFPGSINKSRLKDVSATLSSNRDNEGKLVYIFYYPRENRGKVDAQRFAKELLEAFQETI